jgi:hypothetical protein
MLARFPQLNLPLEPAPSFRQGFGRLNLTRTLPVGGIAPPGWRMQVGPCTCAGEQRALSLPPHCLPECHARSCCFLC